MNYEHMGKSQDAMSWLNYWITERERVRIAKERGEPKPWSADPIFQTTYFCNVRREDDKVTKWIRQNWTQEHYGSQYDYSIVLARMLNNIPCLEEIFEEAPDVGDFPRIQTLLETRAKDGLQVWGGAYLVSTHGLRLGKATYLCQRVLPRAYEALAGPGQQRRYTGNPPTLAWHHGALMQLEGLGSFMAAQVIADLKNTEGHPLAEAEDWEYWSAPGPGSLRGLGWIFDKKISPGKYDEAMDYVADSLTHESTACIHTDGRFNMQDLQNCLCEFDKFMRVMTKTGKSKRKYDGT